MYGVPYTRYRDETIVDSYYVNADLERGIIDEAPYICIETDKSKYYTYAFSKLTAKPGDTVPQFTLLATFNEVLDYVNAPGWWEHSIFPDALLDGNSGLGHEQKMELMDKVLKYNTVYVKIGVSFETYQTYLRQVREFHKIIESGFPVYLYPLVEPLFRAVFVDTEKAADGDNDMNADMVMASAYDYGHARRFDGVYHYYMDPHMAHGRDAVARPDTLRRRAVVYLRAGKAASPPGDHHGRGLPQRDDPLRYRLGPVPRQHERHPRDTRPAQDH